MVQWNSGEAATLHILVVQAMIVSLTYGAPKGESCHQELLDIWFTVDGEVPSAFLVDTSEEALLFPDWLKLRMIRASVARLVSAALKDLEPSQLVLFVQSFGIPVGSMNQLLAALDESVEADLSAVEDAVADRAYMAQLVEVQWLRGVMAGHTFHKWLKNSCADENDVEMKDLDKEEKDAKAPVAQTVDLNQLTHDRGKLTVPSSAVLRTILSNLFLSKDLATKQYTEGRVLQKFLQQEFLQTKSDYRTTEETCKVMNEILDSSTSDLFLNNLHARSTASVSIFALLIQIKVGIGVNHVQCIFPDLLF